jgi:hypothetical protein
MATRKPRVDPLVPTHDVDRILGWTHVRTPDADVVAMLNERMASVTDPRWTPAIRRQTIRYALWRHHRNLAEALAVGLR